MAGTCWDKRIRSISELGQIDVKSVGLVQLVARSYLMSTFKTKRSNIDHDAFPFRYKDILHHAD